MILNIKSFMKSNHSNSTSGAYSFTINGLSKKSIIVLVICLMILMDFYRSLDNLPKIQQAVWSSMNSSFEVMIFYYLTTLFPLQKQKHSKIAHFLYQILLIKEGYCFGQKDLNYIVYMRGNSRINRQQQVEVVVRLKPEQSENRFSKCVYLSQQDENQLVVQAGDKKEIFMFDHIAHEALTQQDVYKMIGAQCVSQSFQGYNCCIFAYGQTGAGKTYSVLGTVNDLMQDPYASSRGVLPRVLEDLFKEAQARSQQKHTIICSYMEIYNEQVFDLLSSDKRIHVIREDAKRGVFVEGLVQQRVGSYRAALDLLLQGEKTRKMASTQMNNESSRSHAIFTVNLESESAEGDVTRSKKAKLHIVDLAGSQRVKHTQVEGERLRQGCNINRSLHVLGNVINSLVQSTRKKKHIPFRDSKLTHYLKDSLGGNSITKFLANVHTNRKYFGDTLSTLMFAKRAKILRMKVELNETTGQNFDALRKQVRRLRQQLAQARYFKTDTKITQRSSYQPDLEVSLERVVTEQDQNPQKDDTLKVFEENQLHYKSLIEIYEQHMKTCLSSSHFQRKQNINIVSQWKNLQRRNISLTNIVKKFPAFTRIYRENILLKQQVSKQQSKRNEAVISLGESMITPTIPNEEVQRKNSFISKKQIQNTIAFYQSLLSEAEQKFKECLDTLQKNFCQLEQECKQKQKKIKDLKKKRQYPPDIQQLKNENQYLHLNILNLQNQIAKFQQNEQRLMIELKQSKHSSAKKPDSRQDLLEDDVDDFEKFYETLIEIRNEAQRESESFDLERSQLYLNLQKLQAEINKLTSENNKLRTKYSKSKSRRRSNQKRQVSSFEVSQTKKVSQSLDFKEEMLFSSKTIKFDNDQLKSLQENFTKQVLGLKMEIKRKHKEVNDIRKELDQYILGDRKIQEQFGKPLEVIIEEFRSLSGKRTLLQSKSMKAIHAWKEDPPKKISHMEERDEKKYLKIPVQKKEEPKLMKRSNAALK